MSALESLERQQIPRQLSIYEHDVIHVFVSVHLTGKIRTLTEWMGHSQACPSAAGPAQLYSAPFSEIYSGPLHEFASGAVPAESCRT